MHKNSKALATKNTLRYFMLNSENRWMETSWKLFTLLPLTVFIDLSQLHFACLNFYQFRSGKITPHWTQSRVWELKQKLLDYLRWKIVLKWKCDSSLSLTLVLQSCNTFSFLERKPNGVVGWSFFHFVFFFFNYLYDFIRHNSLSSSQLTLNFLDYY